MTDDFQSIFERARVGERAAMEVLLERHVPGLRAFVRARSGDALRAQESCSDLVQSVCREVLHDVGGIECRGEGDFKRWLYTVALHKIHHKVRHHAAQKREAGRARPIDGAESVLQGYASLVTPSRQAAAREEIGRIEAAIDALPEDYRTVLLEARMLGRTHREIAEKMGRTEVAVRKLLTRARARLAVLLKG